MDRLPTTGMALRFAERNKGERSKRWIAIFIGFIMLASVIGFVFSFAPAQANFKYGGLAFRQLEQGGYMAEIDGRPAYFAYRPEELSDISVTDSIVNLLTGSRSAWITYDWNSSLAREMALMQFDTAMLLDARHDVFVQPAFTTENPLNISVKGCDDATAFVPVLLLQESNDTMIAISPENQNCVVVGGTDIGFQRAADRLKYAVIGEGK